MIKRFIEAIKKLRRGEETETGYESEEDDDDYEEVALTIEAKHIALIVIAILFVRLLAHIWI